MLAFWLVLLASVFGFRVGEQVMVHHGGFYLEAEVLSVRGDSAKVKLLYDEPETVDVPLDRVSSMDLVGNEPEGFRGPWVLYHSHGNFWFLGKILSSDASGLTLVDPDGGEPMEVRYTDVYYPPAEWVSNLAEEAKIQITGVPLGAGDPVEVGDDVVAEQFEGSWAEGRVTAVRRGKYEVAFAIGDPGEVSVARAAPVPSSDESFDVDLSDVIFVRLSEISAWVPARVDRIEGANLTVTLGSGETIYVTPGDYLPQAQ
jgi:hypothetical protein